MYSPKYYINFDLAVLSFAREDAAMTVTSRDLIFFSKHNWLSENYL